MLTQIVLHRASRIASFAALLTCASARGAEPPPTPQARAHFNAGVSHLQQLRYAEAYREFKGAYRITPRWTILGNIGLAAEHLERDGEAIAAMEDYLERGGSEIAETEAHSVRAAIARLTDGSAKTMLDAPGTFWIIDTRVEVDTAVVNEYGPFQDKAELRVRAGQHEFRLHRSSIDAPAWAVTLAAADSVEHVFEKKLVAPNPAPIPPPAAVPEMDNVKDYGPSTFSYVLWGTGAAGAVAAVAMTLHAVSIQNEADEEFAKICSSGSRDDSSCAGSTGRDNQAAQWRTGALVTGVGALGALVTGTILYLVRDRADTDAVANEAFLEPWLSPAGIGLAGSF